MKIPVLIRSVTRSISVLGLAEPATLDVVIPLRMTRQEQDRLYEVARSRKRIFLVTEDDYAPDEVERLRKQIKHLKRVNAKLVDAMAAMAADEE